MKEYLSMSDVKRELHKRCKELFQSTKVAEEIYLDLLQGVDICEVFYLDSAQVVSFEDPRP